LTRRIDHGTYHQYPPSHSKRIRASNLATVDFGGINKEVDISLVNADVGTYVIIHAGYAIQVLNEEEANRSLEYFRELLDE